MSADNTPAHSDNVFAVLGLPDPDGTLAKSRLILQITQTISSRGLDHNEAATLLGIEQSELVDILDGKRLKEYPITKLLGYLKELELDLEEEEAIEEW